MGDYVGLLVSLHVLNLSGFLGCRVLTRREQFEMNQFQQGEFERQENLRRRLGLRTDIPLNFGLAPGKGRPRINWLTTTTSCG